MEKLPASRFTLLSSSIDFPYLVPVLLLTIITIDCASFPLARNTLLKKKK